MAWIPRPRIPILPRSHARMPIIQKGESESSTRTVWSVYKRAKRSMEPSRMCIGISVCVRPSCVITGKVRLANIIRQPSIYAHHLSVLDSSRASGRRCRLTMCHRLRMPTFEATAHCRQPHLKYGRYIWILLGREQRIHGISSRIMHQLSPEQWKPSIPFKPYAHHLHEFLVAAQLTLPQY